MDRARPFGKHVVVLLGICIAGLAHLRAFSIPELVREAAQSKNKTPKDFLEKIRKKSNEWQRGTEIAGRGEFVGFIKKVMEEPGFNMVIGGKSLGKTKIIKSIAESFTDDDPLLLVDMRKASSTDAMRCMIEEAKKKWLKKYPPFFRAAARALSDVGSTDAKKGDFLDGVAGTVALTLADLLNQQTPESTEFLMKFVEEGSSKGQIPIIIIDEANVAFPNGNGTGAGKGEAARAAMRRLIAVTKAERMACVILVASEYSFPYRLENVDFGDGQALSIIVAPEVEEEAMIEVLTTKWGMPQDLAEAFYESFGGDIFLCSQALAKLVMRFSMGKEDLFDPYSVRSAAGLAGLVRDPLTREHMEQMANQGWSPVEEAKAETETRSQRAARIIAKRNVGAVITDETATFNLPFEGEMFKDDTTQQVLIPTTQYMRKCIQKMVEAVRQKSWWRRILRLLGFK